MQKYDINEYDRGVHMSRLARLRNSKILKRLSNDRGVYMNRLARLTTEIAKSLSLRFISVSINLMRCKATQIWIRICWE